MARPRKFTDEHLKQIEQLASFWCTNQEIAAFIGCDASLLSKTRYSELILKGKDKGKIKLRKKMYETALSGNCTMMIFLSKQMLGYADKIDQSSTNTVLIDQANEISKMNAEELVEFGQKLIDQARGKHA